MRKKIVIGNWKMNTNINSGIELLEELKTTITTDETVICVPYTHLHLFQNNTSSNILIGAQNVSEHEKGAYTGEISANMLQSLKISYVIIGHSERRTYFNESNEQVNLKVQEALKHQIQPIICCGESLELRKNNTYFPFIKEQITAALKEVSEQELKNCIIAYEPIWAIGTGETASAAQAQEVHAFIRQELAVLYSPETAAQITIVYGGSVKPNNATELFNEQDIDGALVGGASLKANDYNQIIKSL